MAILTETVLCYETAHKANTLGDTLHPGGLPLTRYALELANLPAGARILDLGCGGGESDQFLTAAGFQVTGLDSSLRLLMSSSSDAQGRTCADAHALPFAPNSFDAILAECTLSLFTPLDILLDSLNALLKEDGVLIVSDLSTRAPKESAKLNAQIPAGCLAGAFDPNAFIPTLHDHGFTLLHWEDHAELLKSLLQPLVFPLVCNIENGKLDSLDLVLQIARAKFSYFLCVAKKDACS